MSNHLGLRVAMIPEPHSSTDLTGCSNVNLLADLGKALHAYGVHSSLFVPGPTSMPVRDQLAGPGLTVEPCGTHDDWMTGLPEPGIPIPVVNLIVRRPFDLVINRKFLHTAQLAYWLLPSPYRWNPGYRLPIVTWYSETMADRWKPLLQTAESVPLTLAMLDASARAVVATAYERDLVIAWARKENATRTLDYINKVACLPVPVETSTLRASRHSLMAARLDRRKHVKTFGLIHGGTLQAKMHVKDGQDAVGTLVARGVPIRFVISTQNDAKDVGLPYVTLFARQSRTNWWGNLSAGEFFYCGSDYEGTGIALIEAVASGLLPIVRPMPWIEDRIPQGYPLVGKTADQLAIVLNYAIEHYDTLVERWLPEWDRTLKQNTASVVAARCADTILRPLQQAMLARRAGEMARHQPMWGLAQKVAPRLPDRMTTPARTLSTYVREASETKADFKHVSERVWRAMAIALGYEDICDGPVIGLRRRGQV